MTQCSYGGRPYRRTVRDLRMATNWWVRKLLARKVSRYPITLNDRECQLPIFDAVHTRLAVVDFHLYQFPSADARKKAAERIADAAVRFRL